MGFTWILTLKPSRDLMIKNQEKKKTTLNSDGIEAEISTNFRVHEASIKVKHGQRSTGRKDDIKETESIQNENIFLLLYTF